MTAALPSPTIGVFDSGVGGLSVLAELRRELPDAHFTYLADGLHCPYGALSDAQVRDLTARGVRWLLARGVQAVVIACNTACAFSLHDLRAQLGEAHPVIGLVPAVKPAVARSRSGVVAVLATPVTLRGTLLADVEARFAAPAGVRVLHLSHPDLVPLVERGELDSPATRAALREVLQPALEAGADQLVLGCTHFPFLAPAIRDVFGARLELSDSGAGVARQTRRVLAERGWLGGPGVGGVEVFTTGDPALFAPVMARLHAALPVRRADLGVVLEGA